MGVKGLTPKHQYAHSPQCPLFISYDKLSWRISLTIKTFLSWWLFFLFSWLHCLIQWQYSAKICQNCQINSADYAYINLTRNRQFHQADFAFKYLTKIHLHRQIHEHSLWQTKFCQICHFRYCMHFWTYAIHWGEIGG